MSEYILICPKCKSTRIIRELVFGGFETICENCGYASEDSIDFDKKEKEMKMKNCIEMCIEKEKMKTLTKDFIGKEYKKAKSNTRYKIPIEIVFWVYRLNLPTTIDGGSIYGTNHTFIELYEMHVEGKEQCK